MAQQTVVQLVDDVTGKEIAPGEGETISFAVNGAAFEIDLDTKGAAKFHTALQFYIDHGRKTGRGSSSTTSTGRRRKSTDIDPAAVRAWAASNNITVSPRGRIAADVIERYKAAGN